MVIWDGAPMHRAKAIRESWRVQRGGISGWSSCRGTRHPNPDEGVRDHLKGVELRNVSCHDQDKLRHEFLRLALARRRTCAPGGVGSAQAQRARGKEAIVTESLGAGKSPWKYLTLLSIIHHTLVLGSLIEVTGAVHFPSP